MKLIFFSLLTFILLLEASTRIFLPQPNLSYLEYTDMGFPIMRSNINHKIAVIPEPVYVRGTVISPYEVQVKTNSQGQRNENEFPFQKQKDKKRILSLGGSIAFGWPLSVEYSYPYILQKNLPNTELINASVIGSSASHMYEYYKKFAHQYNPDLILLQLRTSALIIDDLIQDSLGMDAMEIDWLSENGFKEWLEKNKKVDIAGLPEVTSETLNKEVFNNMQADLSGGGKANLLLYQYSHFIRLLRWHGLWLGTGIGAKNYLARNAKLTELSEENKVQFSNRSHEFTEAYISDIKRLADQKSAKLLVIIVPNKFGCEKEVLIPWQKLISNLDKKKINTVSLFEEFCDLKVFKPKPLTFIEDESHPTIDSYKLIADKIISSLSKTQGN